MRCICILRWRERQKIIKKLFSEVVYKDYQYELEPDPEAYTTCSECGKPLSVYNDFNGGKCPECAAVED